jgi:hypothetical protein
MWAGAPQPEHPRDNSIDPRRSVTLYHYAPLAKVPGLCLVSLQKGEAAGRSRLPPEGIVLHDWTAEPDDFADTAALVDALDLIISVDTSVVHLAGALGKPMWLLNRFDQGWRWLSARTDSPWYPTARPFRQPEMGNREAVIGQVRHVLSAVIDGGGQGLPTLAQIQTASARAPLLRLMPPDMRQRGAHHVSTTSSAAARLPPAG